MTEEAKERMEKWRTDRIVEYARLEAERQALSKRWEENITITLLQIEVKKALDKLEDAEKPYHVSIGALNQQQTGIKSELVESWSSTEDKTFECDVGTATLRTNRSLKIRSKAKLVEFLATLNKLPDFVKTFDVTKLRKIKDAGLLDDDIASYEEKKSIAIKLTEADQ